MSKMSELDYDIEQLYIEGHRPTTISAMLECPLSLVYDWLESCNVEADVAETPQDEELPDYYGA
jgi:hypothetical protein